MQFIRTLIWVLILVALLLFSFFNWQPVEVVIWDNLVWNTKLPVLAIVSFLAGLVPMWLIQRGSSWKLQRRIRSLETAAQHNAAAASYAETRVAEPALADPRYP